MNCIRCGSGAINHHMHGRDKSDPDLCDVCYWRKRASKPNIDIWDFSHSKSCNCFVCIRRRTNNG